MRPVRSAPVSRAPVSQAVIQRRAHLTREIIEVLVLIAIVFLITRFVIQARSVIDTAMRPSLEPNQQVMVNSVAFLFGDPQRGDVVIFANPSNPSQILIRRIVAIPDDTVTLTATTVQINGATLNEPYISVPYGTAQNTNIEPGLKLKSSEYYVMCDARLSDSCANTDSRSIGPVPRANLMGKAVLVYWPLTSFHLLPNYSDVFSAAGARR